MSGSAQVTPVISFPDADDAVLDYLAARTERTVGFRVDAADAVVRGEVVRLEPVTIVVERWLAGQAPAAEILVIPPAPPAGAGGPPGWIPAVGERGLAFLRRHGAEAYALAPGEAAPVPDTQAAELAEAVEWYVGLPPAGAGRERALVDGLSHPNPRIARSALHAAMNDVARGDSAAAEQLAAVAARRYAPGDKEDEWRDRIMVALWVAGAREAAVRQLRERYRFHGKDAWLASRDIGRSVGPDGRGQPVLYGPDPAAVAGD